MNKMEMVGKEAWDYLVEIGHNWTSQDPYDPDCSESYIKEAFEHGFFIPIRRYISEDIF